MIILIFENNKLKKKNRILVNASTCVVGGGVQVSTSFINEASKDSSHEFIFIVSEAVFSNLDDKIKKFENILIQSPSPARPLSGYKTRNKILKIEEGFKPDIVFTVFGPSYINFSSKHLCGLADGWVTHMSKIAFNSLPFIQKSIFLLRSYYKKKYLFKKDFYWVETEVAKKGLMKRLSFKDEKIKVIPNTYSSSFIEKVNKNSEGKSNFIKVLTISAPYYHKNLKIIPEIAKLIIKKDKVNKYKFYVTLPVGTNNKIVNEFWDIVREKSVQKSIQNLGVLRNDECPYWYLNSNIIFMPSLLETSSAIYPEAMILNKPIITTNLDFAHSSCGDAALYYDPLSAESASEKIMELSSNKKLMKELISIGKEKIKNSLKPNQKYNLIIKYIESIISD